MAKRYARLDGNAAAALLVDHQGVAFPAPPTIEAGGQLMRCFAVACELHRDWRNDVEGLGTLFSNHTPDYRNLMTSYSAKTSGRR